MAAVWRAHHQDQPFVHYFDGDPRHAADVNTVLAGVVRTRLMTSPSEIEAGATVYLTTSMGLGASAFMKDVPVTKRVQVEHGTVECSRFIYACRRAQRPVDAYSFLAPYRAEKKDPQERGLADGYIFLFYDKVVQYLARNDLDAVAPMQPLPLDALRDFVREHVEKNVPQIRAALFECKPCVGAVADDGDGARWGRARGDD